MDYEKLHKDTINKLQQMVSCGKITVETACGICADFVPESEDERIRKELINGFNKLDKSAVWYNGITNAQILAWLEKQGEKKFGWSEYDEIALNRIIPTLESLKVKVKAPAYLLQDIVWLKSLKDRVQPQPKQEWNEKDQKIWEEISDMLWEGYKKTYSKFSWDDIRNWLKPKVEFSKCRVQLQPRQEWSEEDEGFLCKCLGALGNPNYCYEDGELECMRNWLKSLRPQSHWKPSEEQIEALEKVTNYSAFPDAKYCVELKRLLGQLKAL